MSMIQPHIPSMHNLPVGELFNTRTYELPPIFRSQNVSYWYSARTAIWQAIKVLNLKSTDTVALPAFCCGSEIEPFVYAGMKVNFFSVDSELNPDIDSLRKALDGASATLFTHYLGFPAKLDEAIGLARENDIKIIEDCAHALYTQTTEGQSVGLKGDVAVFSFWKTAPLADGGALIINNGDEQAIDNAAPPPASLVKAKTRHLISQGLYSSSNKFLRSLEQLRRNLKSKPISSVDSTMKNQENNGNLIKFHPELASAAMSHDALERFNRTNHKHIFEKRRQHYLAIENTVKQTVGIRPLYKQLRTGTCPLFFPLFVENDKNFRRVFAQENIGVKHMWPWFHPLVPWQLFEHERQLKSQLIGLPIHHQLTTTDIERIKNTLQKVSTS